jgi:hypothetical protein
MTPDNAASDELARLLHRYSGDVLVAMCRFQGVAPRSGRQSASVIGALTGVLAERERVQGQWQHLSVAERALVEGLLRRGGHASTRVLRDELVRLNLVDQDGQLPLEVFPQLVAPDPHAAASRRFDEVLSRLALRGWVFAAEPPANPGSPLGSEPHKRDFVGLPQLVFIPEPIRRQLPAPSAAPDAPLAPDAVTKSSARMLQRDLYLYWSSVRRRPVHITQKDEVQKSDLRKINSTLLVRETLGKGQGEFDHPRLRFLRQLLMALGLMALSDTGELAAQLPPDDFFAAPPPERVRRSFEAWLANDYFNELLLLDPLRIETSLLSAPDLVVRARQAVVKAVKTLARHAPDAGWLALSALVGLVRAADSEFLFRRATFRPSAYARVPVHPYAPQTDTRLLESSGIHTEDDGWEAVEAGFVGQVVAGPLFWLGLADLGGGQASAARPGGVFRLTAMGRWVLGLGPCPEIPAEGGRIIVQPNLHIVTLDPVSDATLANLDRFAERLTAERAVEYQLTRASVYAGQQSGWDVVRIKEFLRQQTAGDLPVNVTRTLDEWQTQHERIVFYPSVALAHGPAPLFDELAVDVQPYVAGRPLPDVLLLKGPQAAPPFLAALMAHDVLALHAKPSAVLPQVVQANTDGALRFSTRRPSLYLHGHLAAFADPDPAGGYQITAETVARAQRAGLSAPDILDRLARVHRGPVPEVLARRIRAWARHYGGAALEDVVLLQVRDADTLAELRSDPELAHLLSPFDSARPKVLARVRAADVETVRALLAERGIDLADQVD